jgi:hypothetical protein
MGSVSAGADCVRAAHSPNGDYWQPRAICKCDGLSESLSDAERAGRRRALLLRLQRRSRSHHRLLHRRTSVLRSAVVSAARVAGRRFGGVESDGDAVGRLHHASPAVLLGGDGVWGTRAGSGCRRAAAVGGWCGSGCDGTRARVRGEPCVVVLFSCLSITIQSAFCRLFAASRW